MPRSRSARAYPWVALLGLGLLLGAALGFYRASIARPDRNSVLNRLRDEINASYGMKGGTPRINCGPCARFAIAFRERWNARFRDKVNLLCVMTADGRLCGHVALKFPNGACFDGGNGVIPEAQLRSLYPDHPLEEMVIFDRNLLDQRVGGLDHRIYPECPNYSDDLTIKLFEKNLALLPRD